MKIEPYLSFEGRCDEAIEFYKLAAGARVETLMRFKDSPDCVKSGKFPPEMLEKVMHCRMRMGDSYVMATDGRCGGALSFSGISLSLTVSNDAEAERIFGAIGDGGQVTMPMGKTFFSSRFGMLTDRFGVAWMILTQP